MLRRTALKVSLSSAFLTLINRSAVSYLGLTMSAWVLVSCDS
jgi:hypothetical protein